MLRHQECEVYSNDTSTTGHGPGWSCRCRKVDNHCSVALDVAVVHRPTCRTTDRSQGSGGCNILLQSNVHKAGDMSQSLSSALDTHLLSSTTAVWRKEVASSSALEPLVALFSVEVVLSFLVKQAGLHFYQKTVQ